MKKNPLQKTDNKRAAYTQSAQDRFLTQLAEDHKKVDVFLINGIKIEGEILAFDQHVVLLKGKTIENVYKHAISTIQTAGNIKPRAHIANAADGNTTRSPTVIVKRTKRALVRD
jgi:host factor-I protein